MNQIIDKLLSSAEPSIRYKVRVRVLGEPEDSKAIADLQQEIKSSERVRTLMCARDDRGRIEPIHHVYKKWKGAHWAMARLADIGHPERDADLIAVREQLLQAHLSDKPVIDRRPDRTGVVYTYEDGVTLINGRPRCCASIPAYVLFSIITLGLADERCGQLAQKLMKIQWPDGGWNCDRKFDVANSSFWETLIPLRALSAYAEHTGDTQARQAAARAAEIFLKRRLFQRERDGQVMNPDFVRLHYPCYWRYDILFALKVMAEAGFIEDERCSDALDLLESKRLPDGGWPAESRFYRVSQDFESGTEWVSWGQVSSKRMNEWVTADALYVLKAAGRLR